MPAPDGDEGVQSLLERVRETEELFRSTVENMPVNLVLCDREGRPLYFNPQLAALIMGMCGKPPEAVLGKPGAEVWPPPIWNPLRTHIERVLATGERQLYELDVELPGGQRMVRQWVVVPMAGPGGEVRRILAMSYDITAQRRSLDEAREADRRKSEFIAVLSHELRNPLAAIRTGLYILGHDGAGKEAVDGARRVIDRQVTQLIGMVDDLLDVTRIAQSKVTLHLLRLDLNRLARDAVEDNRADFDEKGVRLTLEPSDGPLYANVDSARFAQVLTNLLSNAAKFTARGGTATISVSGDGSAAVVSVSDTGIGIERSLLSRVFETFIQGDRTLHRAGGGLGVGLALVKGIVGLHGGQVHASSPGVGQGATFVVRLPLAVEEAAGPAPSRPAVAAPSCRVLVIEDEHDVADSLRVALGLLGHVVEVAHDGLRGLAKARTFVPDVVLCDLGLPEMDGYDVARAFRADEALRSIYLVALSGYAQNEDIQAAASAGFDQHLAKPASIEGIRAAIANGRAKVTGDS